LRAGAGIRAAALEHPDVALLVDVDRARPAPAAAVGKLRPAVLAVGIVLGAGERRGERSDQECFTSDAHGLPLSGTRVSSPQAGSWKFAVQCDPSQNGLFFEAPQRHSV